MKLWSGRFQKNTDAAMDAFHSSISFDCRMYREDIAGSIAHAAMLGRQGIIPEEDAEKIVGGLRAILLDIEAGKVEFTAGAEDIHMNVESLLIERIGEAGKRVHTGRSRNDQVALDMRMYLKSAIEKIRSRLKALVEALVSTAEANTRTVMPGYTHLQKAQPVTLAHHLLAYAEMFLRDLDRFADCKRRTDVLPLGPGRWPAPPILGPGIRRSGAWFCRGFQEFDGQRFRPGFLRRILLLRVDRDDAPFALLRGADPLVLGRVPLRGDGRRLFDRLLHYAPEEESGRRGADPRQNRPGLRGPYGPADRDEGHSLAYNKDMQEDKEATFDAFDTLFACLDMFTRMFKTLKFNQESMEKGAARGFANATDAADYLVKKGLPFRSAHEAVGKLVFRCIQEQKAIGELSLDELKEFSPCSKGTFMTPFPFPPAWPEES